MTIVSATGHRPNKLGSYDLPNPIYNYVCKETERILKELNPDKCISGAALGYDQYFMNVCFRLGIPVIAAVPFIGQEKMWPEKSQRMYHKLLEKAESVVIISEGGYSAQKMRIRNEWMSNNSDIVLACFDGSRGGTGNAVAYAQSKNKKIIFIDPRLALKGLTEKEQF